MSFSGVFSNNLGYDDSTAAADRFNASNWENNTTHQYADPSTNENGWYDYPLNAGGPSQPYTGVGVVGGTGGFTDPNCPATVPATWYLANRMSHGGDKSRCSP